MCAVVIFLGDWSVNGLVSPQWSFMSTPIAPTALPSVSLKRLLSFLALSLYLCAMLWMTWCGGRVPSFLSPTVERALYFKLPIAGTRFHWRFLDSRAFLSGELTLRIVNAGRDRDQTVVVFRNGNITEGWQMIGDRPNDPTFYFGLSTGQRFATAVGDSVIVTLTVTEDLQGRGPYSQGTLTAGTWIATGTYTSLYGGTLNPLRDLMRVGKPPMAFLTCWDITWALRDASDEGWMGPKPAGEDDVSFMEGRVSRRGVDGRRCRSTL